LYSLQTFDHFLGSKFTTTKRYGGEGAESAMLFYNQLFSAAAMSGVTDVVMCIAHRGRLNLLACVLRYPLVTMFQKMKGKREFPPNVVGDGDVLSHLTSSLDLTFEGRSVHVTLIPNPSHLEAANPVAAGKVRARMQSKRVGEYSPDNGQSAREQEDQPSRLPLCFQVDSYIFIRGLVMVLPTCQARCQEMSISGLFFEVNFCYISFYAKRSRFIQCIELHD